jgi:hypothetical protein
MLRGKILLNQGTLGVSQRYTEYINGEKDVYSYCYTHTHVCVYNNNCINPFSINLFVCKISCHKSQQSYCMEVSVSQLFFLHVPLLKELFYTSNVLGIALKFHIHAVFVVLIQTHCPYVGMFINYLLATFYILHIASGLLDITVWKKGKEHICTTSIVLKWFENCNKRLSWFSQTQHVILPNDQLYRCKMTNKCSWK